MTATSKTLTVGSLFAGIGGFDLAAERVGWDVKWQVEIDDYATRVLEKHWPHVRRYRDIREVSGAERVDVLCGGFPCQPVSLAGARRAQRDERWLWPEFARLVRDLRPRYVVVENVPGLFTAGFDDVLGDLAALGMDAEWESIPARAVGAPHIRERVWIVAYANRWRQQERTQFNGATVQGSTNRHPRGQHADGLRDDVADSSGNGLEGAIQAGHGQCARARIFQGRSSAGRSLASGAEQWLTEPNVGRVAYGVPARVDRLRGLGNAIVPQVAEWIFRQIQAAEESVIA